MAVVAGAVTAVVAAFISALVLAIVDLYLTGHSLPSITRPLLGTSSAADLILLAVSALAGIGAGWAVWRGSRTRTGDETGP